MVLHILEHLLDERFHVLHLFVLLRMEVSFVLIVHAIRDVFLRHRLVAIICLQELLLVTLIWLLVDIFTEAKFVKFWSAVVWLEVVIDVYEREILHSCSIYGLGILESLSLREGRFPIEKI